MLWLLEFLKTIWPSLVGAVKILATVQTGKALAEGKRAQDDLKTLQNAADAVARNKSRPVDERLRDARKRGLYRVRTKSPHD